MGNKRKNKKNNKVTNYDQSLENKTEVNVEQEGSSKMTEESDVNLKRSFEGDCESEEIPKKKKKRKTVVNPDSTDKKGKKSIRQIKREKHLQRLAEAQAVSQDQLKSQCLSYLSQWKHDRSNWKFMKVKQIWLNKNKFSDQLIPESSWPTLMEYFESAQGNIRNILLEDANKIIKEMDDWTEKQTEKNNTEDNDDTQSNPEICKPSEIAYKRARDLIQSLQ